MDLDESIHIRPSQVFVRRRIYDEVVQEGQLLDVVPLGDEVLANKLHSSIEVEQDQAAEDSVLREECMLFGRGANSVEFRPDSNIMEQILYDP